MKTEIGIRINRYIASSGITSRRKAEELILSGVVRVNGKIITDLGHRISSQDSVTVNNKPISIKQKKIYILLNKPKDFITTVKDEKDRKTVLDLINIRDRIFPIGRLDRNTTGVLLLTNDGDLANFLMHPKFLIEKEYKVTLDKSVTRSDMQKVVNGIQLDDGLAKATEIFTGKNNYEVHVKVHEGRNHLIRRIFESMGYQVEKLDRVSYAGFTTTGLPRGKWRFLKHIESRKLTDLYNKHANE